MEKSLFEQMGGTYKQVGDYLLPDIELPEEKPIGVWSTRHYQHLRKANRILFSRLTISGKPLADICVSIAKKYENSRKMSTEMMKTKTVTKNDPSVKNGMEK